jgi:hypothetical protein
MTPIGESASFASSTSQLWSTVLSVKAVFFSPHRGSTTRKKASSVQGALFDKDKEAISPTWSRTLDLDLEKLELAAGKGFQTRRVSLSMLETRCSRTSVSCKREESPIFCQTLGVSLPVASSMMLMTAWPINCLYYACTSPLPASTSFQFWPLDATSKCRVPAIPTHTLKREAT